MSTHVDGLKPGYAGHVPDEPVLSDAARKHAAAVDSTRAAEECASRCRPSTIPIQISGIALNVIGLAGLLVQINKAHPELSGLAHALRWPLVAESLTLQAMFVLRVFVCWRAHNSCSFFALRELRSTRVTSTYGAFLIAVQLGGMHLHAALQDGTAVVALTHTASVLQYVVGGYFLACCIRRRKWPEPYWFPPTVSFATPAIVGPAIGTGAAVQYLTLACGGVVALICWPPCVWRAIMPRADGARISDNPAIFVMMAPVPFVTMAFYSVLAGQGITHHDDAPVSLRLCVAVLVVLNMLNLILTAWAAFQRRRALRAALWPLSPAWASLTFPL
eukprot:414219-Prymnesium_polylepis.1